MKKKEFLTNNTLPEKGVLPAEKGKGVYFWDISGKKYLDFSSQTLNLLLGQCHPKIVEAIQTQAGTLTYASSRFATSSYLRAAERLAEVAPAHLTRVNIKMCDGSDANETAVKIARKYTGRTGIISFNKGHTGQTTQTIQLRGYGRDPKLLAGNQEDIVFVNPPNIKEKGAYHITIKQIRDVILEHGNIAAILIDPVMVNAGLLVTQETKDYLQSLEALCKEHDIIFILDENQSFGWVEGMFVSRLFDLKPDIITMGKGLSGGHPLAGVVVTEVLSTVLDYNEADFTHGGHALTCAAADACLSVLQEEDFEISRKSEIIKSRLSEIMEEVNIPMIYRGVGLIHALEVDTNDFEQSSNIARNIFENALNNGLFLRRYNNHIIVKPPIIITEKEINEGMDILLKTIKKEAVVWN